MQVDPSDKMWHSQPIHKAAAEGHLSVVKLLVWAGVLHRISIFSFLHGHGKNKQIQCHIFV